MVLASCGESRRTVDSSAQGFGSYWTAKGLTEPGDALSDEETACIADIEAETAKQPPDTVFVPGTTVAMSLLASVFDTCLTVAHQQRFLVVDMLSQPLGYTSETATCMAPGLVALADDEGFEAVLVSPDALVSADKTTVALRCGVVGPERRREAAYLGGIRTGNIESLQFAFCPGAYSAAEIAGLSQRISAATEADRASTFMLVSDPEASPEVWSGSARGRPVELRIVTGTDDGRCVMAVTASIDDLADILIPS